MIISSSATSINLVSMSLLI